MKKKRLNIAIFHLAFFYSGGGEKLVLEEIKGLAQKGHKVTCFVPIIDKKLSFPDVIANYNIKTFFSHIPKIIPHYESLEILLSCILFPFIAFRFKKFDVILGANQPGPWFAWWVKFFSGKPYIIYLAQPTRILYPREIDKEVGMWVRQKSYFLPWLVRITKPIFKWADIISIRGADKMLVNGSYIGKVITRIYNKKYIVCAAGASTVKDNVKNRWEGEIKINGFSIKKPYILLTNRHFPQKKFEYAIEAMPVILKKFPDVTLVITGNRTEYTNQLIKLCIKNSLQEKVLFTGFVSEKNITKLYASASLYVYTSPEEDFGMGIIESMAAGVPVVAWNKGGPSTTIINNETGFLAKPYLQKEFTEKIIYLLSNKNKNLEMGKKAKKTAADNFSYKKHIDTLEEALIDTAANGKN